MKTANMTPSSEKVGPGRPDIGPACHISLTPGLMQAVDAKAEAEGVSRAEMIRRLLEKALEQNK